MEVSLSIGLPMSISTLDVVVGIFACRCCVVSSIVDVWIAEWQRGRASNDVVEFKLNIYS
jgi:hypothetical protein